MTSETYTWMGEY